MVKAIRFSLVVVILLNLALLAVSGPLRTTLTRYELARKQTELRKLVNENRALLGGVGQSRRPDRVASRAQAMGLDLHLIESEAMAGQPPVERRPLPVVQRR
jgi:cell division protein FtsL